MKRVGLIFLLTLAAAGGCADRSTLIRTETASHGTAVAEELAKDGSLPQGYAALGITASFKTHADRPSLVYDPHGTPDFKLLVSIDGQETSLRGALQEEKGGSLDLVDPENGPGIRYRFDKKLRLKAGVHRVVVALPGDGVVLQREISLAEGKVHSLVVEPVYGAKSGKPRPGISNATSFREGIRTLRILLDGQVV
ncbi:MAG TPA: hypothetical protein DCZ75_00330 [Geobacter sp.]|nr:hypothetical protein [Geobacter sp.]